MDRAVIADDGGEYYGGFRQGVDGAPTRTKPVGPSYPSNWETGWTE